MILRPTHPDCGPQRTGEARPRPSSPSALLPLAPRGTKGCISPSGLRGQGSGAVTACVTDTPASCLPRGTGLPKAEKLHRQLLPRLPKEEASCNSPSVPAFTSGHSAAHGGGRRQGAFTSVWGVGWGAHPPWPRTTRHKSSENLRCFLSPFLILLYFSSQPPSEVRRGRNHQTL